MRKIFQEHGGVIVTVIAVVCLIALVTFLMSSNGTVSNSFRDVVNKFVQSASGLLDAAANGASDVVGGNKTQEIEVPGLGNITVKNPNGVEFTYDAESGILMGASPVSPVEPGEVKDNTPMIEFTAGTFEASTNYTPGEYELESYEVVKTRAKKPVAHNGGMYLSCASVGEGKYQAYEITADCVAQASTYIAYCTALNSNTTVNGIAPYTLHYRAIANSEDDTLENAIYLAAYTQQGTGFSWKVAQWDGSKYVDVDCRTEIDAIKDFTEAYTETVTKIVVISKPESSTEYVYIPSGTMKAEEGMTWAKWLASEYNTLDYDVTKVWDANYNEVALDSNIVAGGSYGFAVVKNEETFSLPLAWNSTDVVSNASFTLDGYTYVKVSNFVPSTNDLIGTSLTLTAFGSELVFNYDEGSAYVDGSGFINYRRDDGNNTTDIALITVSTECEGIGTTFPEAGLYVQDFVPSGANADFVLDLTDSSEG